MVTILPELISSKQVLLHASLKYISGIEIAYINPLPSENEGAVKLKPVEMDPPMLVARTNKLGTAISAHIQKVFLPIKAPINPRQHKIVDAIKTITAIPM